MAKPLKYRKLQATMKLKEISLGWVAAKAGINMSTASLVLNGRLLDPLKLKKLSDVIERAPMPPDTIPA